MNTRERLLERFRQLSIIDAHEHLMSESEQLAMPMDALTVYRQYTRLPMFASGLPQEDWRRMHDPELPLLRRWAILKPYLDRIKHTSFARAAKLTLQGLWNVDELTETNLISISEQIAAESKPGLYQRILHDKCRIVRVLNQDTGVNGGKDMQAYRGQSLLAAVVALVDTRLPDNVEINRLGGEDGFSSVDDYLEWARERLRNMAVAGAVGFKTTAYAIPIPDRQAALEEFADLQRTGRPACLGSPPALFSYLQEELLRAAAYLGLPVAVHTGFWGVNRHDPSHFIPVIERNPEIHFDLFHAGVSHVRVLGIMAVNYANTSVNLCWAHSINAAMTASALDEYVDELGTDKIIAFGGDVRWMVHKVYGHLELARQNIAAVLARRVDDGRMGFAEAEELAKKWFWDNPARIYKLPVD